MTTIVGGSARGKKTEIKLRQVKGSSACTQAGSSDGYEWDKHAEGKCSQENHAWSETLGATESLLWLLRNNSGGGRAQWLPGSDKTA